LGIFLFYKKNFPAYLLPGGLGKRGFLVGANKKKGGGVKKTGL